MSVMSMLHLKNGVQKNGFDLSRKNAFSAKAGMLLPVFCQETLPNSEYDINVSAFTRTMPLNTAAYVRIKEYFDFYFVPLRLLYRYAPQMFAQSNEQFFATSADGTPVLGVEFPYVQRQVMHDFVEDLEDDTDIFGYDAESNAVRLLEYLGYGDITSAADDQTNINLWRLLAYQKVYQDYFRNSQWETSDATSYNIDYITPGASLTQSALLKQMFALHYCLYQSDYFMGLLPNSQYGDVAEVSVGSLSGSVAGTVQSEVVTDDNGSLLRYYFTDADGNKLSLWNTNSGTTDLGFLNNGQLQGYTASGTASNDTTKATRLFLTGNQSLGSANGTVSIDASALGAGFSILALRRAQAAQKYAEIAQSNSKDYQGQMQAHFGAHVPNALSMKCQYLGGTTSVIQIGDVINQNLASSTDKATISGKGTGTNNGHIHFQAAEHGIIIGIYHAAPLLDYAPVGLNPFNRKISVTDFAIPEFDRIGMQPTYLQELAAVGSLSSLTSDSDIDEINDFFDQAIGYAPRYAEYKTAVDEIHGAFYNGGLDAWTAPLYSSFVNALVSGESGSRVLTDYNTLMHVNPAVLNPIFLASADETIGSGTDSDQFLVNSFFNVKAVLPLDRNGLPY